MVRQTRQQRRHPLKFIESQKSGNQAKLNCFLWRLVMNQGGMLQIPYSDITNIPAHAGIEVDNIPGTDKVEIRAVVNSPISIPTKRIIANG